MEDILKTILAHHQQDVFCASVITNRCLHAIKRESVKVTSLPSPFGGIRIWVKDDQKMPAWMFSKEDTAMRYMQGDLSEEDLMKMDPKQVHGIKTA